MASSNPFDLLVDDDNDDPIQLIAKLPAAPPATKKSPAGVLAAKSTAKFPSKPNPPAQAVQEARNDGQRGGGRFGGRGRGFNRNYSDNGNSNGAVNNGGFNRSSEDGGDVDKSERRGGFNGPRGNGGYRGGRRGGYSNGADAEGGDRPRRVFERHSGTGRGNEFKREGAGRGNWGTATDEVVTETEEAVIEGEKKVDSEKPAVEEESGDVSKENFAKEEEEKKMTLEEYEKVLEEKRKGLLALKSEERKVDLDEGLAKLQLLSNKKTEEDIFVKLGSEKDKRKEAADKEDKAKKSVSINEFLKGGPGGRGRGRGRGPRGGGVTGGGNRMMDVAAPAIGDKVQFPSLSVK